MPMEEGHLAVVAYRLAVVDLYILVKGRLAVVVVYYTNISTEEALVEEVG